MMEWQSSYVKKKQDKLTSCTVTILTLPLLPSPSFCQSLVRPPLSTLDTFLHLSGESMCREIFWRSTDNFDIWFKHVFWQNVLFFFLHSTKKFFLSCKTNLTGHFLLFSGLIYPQKLPTSKRNFISWARFPNLTKKTFTESLCRHGCADKNTFGKWEFKHIYHGNSPGKESGCHLSLLKRKRFGFLSCFNEVDER